VQGGQPHRVGKGSGKLLQDTVVHELREGSSFGVILTDNQTKFTHTEYIEKREALAEAKRLKADYCLILELGEFRNAIPMGFRSDFVTLESGVLYEVSSGKEVWRLSEPYMLEKDNVGNHLGLIENIGQTIVHSIAHTRTSIKATRQNKLKHQRFKTQAVDGTIIGKILLMPPHDVIQGGKPHHLGKGSGRLLQHAVVGELIKKPSIEVLSLGNASKFTNTGHIRKQEAVAEAKRLNADYCLILELGEFRDARAMSLSKDFVVLKSGVLYEVSSGKVAWQLSEPYRLEKSSLGNYLVVPDKIGFWCD